jgi:environmental stress-induced protein Ves
VVSRFAGALITGRVSQCHPERLAADSQPITFAASVIEMAMKGTASEKHDFKLLIRADLQRL